MRRRQRVRGVTPFKRGAGGFPPGFPIRSQGELRAARDELRQKLEQQGIEFHDVDVIEKGERERLRRRRRR